MFSRISRYRTLPDIVTTDAEGRTLVSKTLRPLPQVSGTFRHTVEDADRLDHLAYKYYQQPQQMVAAERRQPRVSFAPGVTGQGADCHRSFPRDVRWRPAPVGGAGAEPDATVLALKKSKWWKRSISRRERRP